MECLVKQDPNDPQALLSLIHSQAERIAELEQQLAWLKRQVFGQKSERVTGAPGQGELFTETKGEAPPTPPAASETITYERRRPKRGPLPRELPRERIELDVEAADKVCPAATASAGASVRSALRSCALSQPGSGCASVSGPSMPALAARKVAS